MTPKLENLYYFVDESGDPTFYDSKGNNIIGKGASRILILGFIQIKDPEIARKQIVNLHKEIADNAYYKGIPSLSKTLDAFHAKDDIPEIREKFFSLIKNLDFKVQFVVARKIESLFKSRHNSKESIFYDDLITKLFENNLHKADKISIYFSRRGSKSRQKPLDEAIRKAKLTFEQKWQKEISSELTILTQTPKGEPCLQIIDYLNWAIFRLYEKQEERYFKFIEEKISLLIDIYDFKKYPKNYYSKSNKFSLEKSSPLQLG